MDQTPIFDIFQQHQINLYLNPFIRNIKIIQKHMDRKQIWDTKLNTQKWNWQKRVEIFGHKLKF